MSQRAVVPEQVRLQQPFELFETRTSVLRKSWQYDHVVYGC